MAVPIYEFRCNHCHAKLSIFVRSISSPLTPKCNACGSEELTRLISRVAIKKSASTIEEELGPPRQTGDLDYYKDPRNIGRWAKKRAQELGADLGPKFDEMVERAQSGEIGKKLLEGGSLDDLTD